MTQNNREKYAYLDQLSTRQLEELLLADAEDTSGQDTSEVILHILEVLQERDDGLAAEPVDVDRAWEEFQKYYLTPEGEGESLYPCGEDLQAPTEKVSSITNKSKGRSPALWRTVRIAAATVAMLAALIFGAEASGLHIFSTLAQWTSETFHFGSGEQTDNYDLFLEELGKHGIPKELAPTWYPSGFVASEPTVKIDDGSITILISLFDSKGNTLNIDIDRYNFQSDLKDGLFEKDSASVEEYSSHGKTFYILSNIDSVTATWSDDSLLETIWGNLSVDDMKAMIDSIGGS